MIFYNINERKLNSKKVLLETNSIPGVKKNVQLTVSQNYLSLLGPFAPFGLQYVTAFDLDTNQLIETKNWTPELKEQAKILKKETPYAWGLFRNTFIVAGLFAALFMIAPIMNKNHMASAAEDQERIKTAFSKIKHGDLLRVALSPKEQQAGGVTLMKVVRISGDTLVIKRHKEVAEGFRTEACSTLDHSEAAYQLQEEKYNMKNFNSYHLIMPFATKENTSPAYVGTAQDIETAG